MASARPVSITVSPADIHLSNVRDRQALLVQAVMANGLTFDVTEKAAIAVENAALVKQDGQTFHPVADGTTKLTERSKCVHTYTFALWHLLNCAVHTDTRFSAQPNGIVALTLKQKKRRVLLVPTI